MDSGMQNATVIPVLLAIDKIVLIKHLEDIAQWPIYLTIGNLSYEIQRSPIRPGGMIVGLISIYKRNFFKIKIEIYYQTIKIITKYKSKYHILYKVI